MIRPIQYLRGIAAMMVVWHHSYTGWIDFGPSGVDIFFVISGFIMGVTSWEKPVGPGRFIALRVVRVVPMYWLATIGMAMMVGWAGIAKSLAFIPYDPSPVLYQGWTLNYEMFFYALFAASLWVPKRFRLAALLGCMVGLVGFGYALRPSNPVAMTYTSSLLLEFAAGAVIGYAWVIERRLPAIAALVCAVMGAILLCKGVPLHGWSQKVGAVLLVAGCLNLIVCHSENRALMQLGNASYSIYLIHPFVLAALKLLPVGAAFPALAMVASAMVGWGCFRLIEKPMTSWLHRLTSGQVVRRTSSVAETQRA
jgi:exopolysaccharide production protein ExoZ